VILPAAIPVRHLIAISEQLHANAARAERFFLARLRRGLAWLSTFLGLPPCPTGQSTLRILKPKPFLPLDGIGFEQCWLRLLRRDARLDLGGAEVRSDCFPEENGPVKWPKHSLFETLCRIRDEDGQ